jgi:hypothetical protein
MNHFDSACFTGLQKSDYIHVHKSHALQIEDDLGPEARDLCFQLLKIFRLQSANQPENDAVPAQIYLDSEGHLPGKLHFQFQT